MFSRFQAFLLFFFLLSTASALSAQNNPYYAVPPGYDFPAGFDFSNGAVPAEKDFEAGESRLLQLLSNGDFTALRQHGWEVFAGITQPTPEGHAVWESWYPAELVFSGPTIQAASSNDRPFIRSIELPRKLGVGLGFPLPMEPGESLAFSVMFNDVAQRHIWDEKLYDRTALDLALAKLDADNVELSERTIVPFPRDAISLKLSWRLVRAGKVRPLAVWDNDLAQPGVKVQPPFPEIIWPRCVAIDPTAKTPEGTLIPVLCGSKISQAKVVHLSRFYNFQIDASNVAVIKQTVGADADVGDFLVLVSLHYTTKEIPDWVWGTFWWHDSPDSGVFGSDRSPKVSGVWKNYVMDVGYSRDLPVGEDGGANDIMNPYVEARFPNGVRSNCMTCHARATLPRLPAEIGAPIQDICGALPVTRSSTDLPSNDNRLRTRVRLDFLWSILLRSAPSEDRLCK